MRLTFQYLTNRANRTLNIPEPIEAQFPLSPSVLVASNRSMSCCDTASVRSLLFPLTADICVWHAVWATSAAVIRPSNVMELRLRKGAAGYSLSHLDTLFTGTACGSSGVRGRGQPDIKRNRLVRVLDEWTEPFDGICLYYPGRRHVPAPLRALVDLVKEIRSGPKLNLTPIAN